MRLFSQNDVLFLFYFLINPTMTTDIGPVAGMQAICVANVVDPMSEAIAPCMGKHAINVRVLIISEQCVVLKVQPRQRRALTRRSHNSSMPGEHL